MNPVSVVVVAHNSGTVLLECLRHLNLEHSALQIVVVDTSSTDGSVEQAAQQYNFEHLRVPNLGYAYAVNCGIAAARHPFVVQMNADVYISPQQLQALVAPLLERTVALVGPTLVGAAGQRQRFGMFDAPATRRFAWISGAIMAFRQDVLPAIGGMDEGFFFYNEDIAWCWKAKQQGYNVLQLPMQVVHLGAHSSSNNPKLKAHGVVGTLRLLRLHYPALAGLYHKALLVRYALYRLFKPAYAVHFKQALEHFNA